MKNLNFKKIILNFGVLILITSALSGQDCEIVPFVLDNYYKDAELLAIKEIQTTDNHEYKDSVFVPIVLKNKYLKIISSIYNYEGATYKDSIFTNYNIHVLDQDQIIWIKTDTTQQWVKNLKSDSTKSGDSIVDTILSRYSLKLDFSRKENLSLKSEYNINYLPLVSEFSKITGILEAQTTDRLVLILPTGCEDKLPDDIELLNDNSTIRFVRAMDACPETCFTNKFWEFTIKNDCNIDNVLSYCNNHTGLDQKQKFDNFNIYPNPFSKTITISNYNLIDNIKIYDLTGSIIYQGNLETDIINLENLAKGIYFIELRTTNNSETKQIVKL